MFARAWGPVRLRPLLAVLAGLALLSAAAGCKAPTPGPEAGVAAVPVAAAPPPATWKYKPRSWAKLEEIERWLGAPGASTDPDLHAEALLQLAEGRLEYALLEREKLAAPVFASRMDAARVGLRAVLDEPHASDDQRERATRSLGRMLAAERAPTPSAPNVAEAPAIIPRRAWGAAAANTARLVRNTSGWDRITVHHSADKSGETASVGTAAGAGALRGIQRYHSRERGWGDIGYHFLIDPAGRIYEGRELKWQGAHAGTNDAGVNQNPRNIGVCVLGDYEDGPPSRQALGALEDLLGWLCATHSIQRKRVFGHVELHEGTACPGMGLLAWVKGYRGARPAAAAAASAPRREMRAGR